MCNTNIPYWHTCTYRWLAQISTEIWSVPYCLQPLVHLTRKLFCPIHVCRRYSPWRMAISSIFLHVPSLNLVHLTSYCNDSTWKSVAVILNYIHVPVSLSSLSFFQQPVLGNPSPSGLSLFFIKLISGLFWQQHLLVFFVFSAFSYSSSLFLSILVKLSRGLQLLHKALLLFSVCQGHSYAVDKEITYITKVYKQ